MESFDESLKYLIEHEPESFIRFASRSPSALALESVPVAIPARGRDVDAAYRISIGGVAMLAHIEFHRRHQSLEVLALDVAEAQIRFYRRERLPVVSIVWDLYGSKSDPVTQDRTFALGNWPGSGQSQSVYRRVHLRGMSQEELLKQAPIGLWPLSPLTLDGATFEAVQEVWARLEALPGLNSSQRADHLAILWFIAGAEDVPIALLKEYLREEKIMESSLYREVFQKWESRGIGLGEVRNKAETISRILAYRMGSLEPSVRAKIASQSTPEILDM